MAGTYQHLDINALFEAYLGAEGQEKEDLAAEIYERVKCLCFGIYARRFRDIQVEDVEDLTHDALSYALEKGKSGGNFRAFLCRVFVNKTLNWLKKNRLPRQIFISMDSNDPEQAEFRDRVLEPPPTEPVDFALREQKQQALDCIATLPERQKRTMRLFLDGFSYKAIEALVPGSAKDHLYHARANVRKCLRDRYGWDDDMFMRFSSR